MTGTKPKYHLISDNILFLSVPLCAFLGMIKFDSPTKILGLCLFVFVFCIIYKLYAKIDNYKKDKNKAGIGGILLSTLGFMLTIGFGIFVDLHRFRWLFLIGIILSVTFSNIISALMSTFAYVLIITIFTGVTPEFVAGSFLTAVMLIIITQYYSDFMSVIYSIITVTSFEAAFYIIMHGLRTDKLISASHIIDIGIISGCILMGWILFGCFGKTDIPSETAETDDVSIDVKDVILHNTQGVKDKSLQKVESEGGESTKRAEKDYSYLLCDKIEAYNRIVSNEKVFNEAKRNSRFVKEITGHLDGNVSLAEAGAFYAECGRIVSNNYIKEGLILAKANNFPNEVIDFIKEHNFKLGYPKSRETAITMIVCKLSATIGFLESKKIKHSVTQIVDGVMDSCLMAGRLDASGLSLNEYKFIKNYLLEEARTGYEYFSGK